ncbi:MAG: hypothetical protein WEA75_02610 [Acidimicrobiia bacterium]
MNEPHDPAETDERDEALAELLTVPPLDDVTRRRMVREALDRPLPRPSRLIGVASVAAAIAIGALVGAVLVTAPEQPDATTAQRAPTPSVSPDAETEAERLTPAGAAESSAIPVTPLGDLGDVTKPADLRDAVDVGFQRSAGPTEDSTIIGYPCAANAPETFGLVAPSALGIGTYNGVAVTVVIGTSPAGEALAVVVQADTCGVLANVRLPKG